MTDTRRKIMPKKRLNLQRWNHKRREEPTDVESIVLAIREAYYGQGWSYRAVVSRFATEEISEEQIADIVWYRRFRSLQATDVVRSGYWSGQ